MTRSSQDENSHASTKVPADDYLRALRKLHTKLGKSLEICVWNGFTKQFLPRDVFSTLFTEEKIRACLDNPSDHLVEFLSNRAQKVFATAVISRGYRPLTPFLRRCFDIGLDDKRLPIKPYSSHDAHNAHIEPTIEFRAFADFESVADSDDSDTDAGVDGDDTRIDHLHWSNFHDLQWTFLAPVFDAANKLEHTFDPLTRFPFIQWGPGSAQGHFGWVHEAVLHPAHHLNFPWPEGAPCRVAVKEFKRSQKDAETSDEAQRAFEGEATVLHDLSQLDHPHIVGRIAAIEYGDKYILLSQWADGGDLRKYWSSNPTPKLDERLVRQTLIQLRGLANAIHALHTGDRLNPLSRTATMRDSLPDVPGRPLLPKIVAADDPSQESDIHFRHGDLKPENILVFNIPGSQIGLLKIGDLGLAKRHYAPTVHRRQATSTKYGTLSYEPPEAITMPARPRSRRYDIWSFGCIMFETMIWLLYGHQGLKSFWDLSVDPARGTLFFTTRAAPVGYQAKVNRHTSLLMERMLAQDLTGAGPPGCALRDLLILIQEKVLVVDLPDFSESSSCRIDAGSLLTEMTNIVDKANGRGGADYLLPNILRNSGRPRKIPIAVDSPQPTAALLAVPGAAQRETYHHEPIDRNDWKHLLDNEFSVAYMSTVANKLGLATRRASDKLCHNCFLMVIQLLSRPDVTRRSRDWNGTCALCSLLRRISSSNQLDLGFGYTIQVGRIGSRLAISRNGQPARSLCLGQAYDPTSKHQHKTIQVSSPQLFGIRSFAVFELLRQWLQDCDHHTRCRRDPDLHVLAQVELPTRLVAIGMPLESIIRVVHPGTAVKYAAVSYRWGNVSRHLDYQTTRANLKKKEEGISLASLPLLLQHAIEVARAIGMGYIWIDALCIIQGPGGDYDTEAERMETVFSGAYCVLAASRASDVSDGFLVERPQREVITVPIPDSPSIFIAEDIDHFQRDVIDGELNQRGWVLQERALARRTIYFAESQIYWECGEGIRCETLTKMYNGEAAFLGDANFPRVAAHNTKGGQIVYFQHLYEQYSRLAFTSFLDRPIAIAGLEQRLCRAFETDGSFGIFERYRGRCILWHRAANVNRLERILFSSNRERVPSWSWMAYIGGITFLDLPFDEVEWADREMSSPWSKQPWRFYSATQTSAWAGRTTNRGVVQLQVLTREFVARVNHRTHPGYKLVWDADESPLDSVRCVNIARHKGSESPNSQYYVLIVKKLDNLDVYERVGVGWLPKEGINFDRERMAVTVQ